MFDRRGLVVLALWSSACAVDDRQLTPAPSDDTGGDYGGQSGTSTGTGEQTGASRSPFELLDGCADLDTDGVPDCQVTLVQNATFTSDTSDWVPDANTELDWDSKNALDDQPSGSAKLTSKTPRASASQCVAVGADLFIIAYANAFVTASAEGGTPAQPELEVSIFDTDDCTGPGTILFDAPPTDGVDTWTVIQAGNITSATTQSASIALVALAGSNSEALAYFDNVMLKTKPH
jgi:hypothetical protein